MLAPPALLRARKRGITPLPVYLLPQRQVDGEAPCAVHGVVAGDEADNYVRSHFGECPFLGGGLGEGLKDVVLGVVEDVFAVGLGDTGGGFLEGWSGGGGQR